MTVELPTFDCKTFNPTTTKTIQQITEEIIEGRLILCMKTTMEEVILKYPKSLKKIKENIILDNTMYFIGFKDTLYLLCDRYKRIIEDFYNELSREQEKYNKIKGNYVSLSYCSYLSYRETDIIKNLENVRLFLEEFENLAEMASIISKEDITKQLNKCNEIFNNTAFISSIPSILYATAQF